MNVKLIAVGMAGLIAGIAGSTLYLQRQGQDQGATEHVHPQPQPAAAGREILYWTDPMLPGFRSATPGKSPMGMEMVPVYADAGGDADAPGTVTVPPGIRQTLGVRTAKAVVRDLAVEVVAPGSIEVAPAARTRVALRAAGWVERLAPLVVGARVEKGERLFDFFAPDIYAAKAEFAAVVRLGGVGQTKPAENRLRVLGVPEAEIAALKAGQPAAHATLVAAPVAGIVAEIAVGEGSYLEPGAAAIDLVDASRPWAVLAVPQSRIGAVVPGLAVAIRLAGDAAPVYDGVVDTLDPRAAEATRAVAVRVKLAAPDDGLRIGAVVAGRIALPAVAGALVVPPSAVIRTGREARVVRALGEGRFRAVPVEIGADTDDGVEIRAGLAAGDDVVVAGQFLIDSESNLRAAAERLELGAGGEGAP
jgi:Cu(I)/Ag(I) efflux system membrane fusion protein